MKSSILISLLVSFAVSAIARNNKCPDDPDFKYANDLSSSRSSSRSSRSQSHRSVKDCSWVAKDKIDRCDLVWNDLSVKEYCTDTCAHTRSKGDCSNGKGVQLQKCLDGEWIDDTCFIVGSPVEDPIKKTDEPTFYPTASPIANESDSDAPSLEPTLTDTSGATDASTISERKGSIRRALGSISSAALSDSTSSEYEAFKWIVDEDELFLSPDDDSLVQRYVLALIYFGMGGDNWNQNKVGEKYLMGTSECDWYGVVCDGDFNVMSLKLDDINMDGSIPYEIGELNTLTELQLESNSIDGSIPSSIGNLSSLIKLSLDGNLLNSTLPEEIFDLRNLELFDVDNNYLSGTISPRIGDLSSLQILSLFDCNFSGTIPSELGKLSNVKEISLDGNGFTGEVPQEICDLRDGILYFLAVDCSGDEDGSPPKVNCDKKSRGTINTEPLECCVCSL